MLTGLGETLRSIRQKNFELLLDMAERLEVSSAFLSSIEHGKKKPPADFFEKIQNLYELHPSTIKKLRQEIDRSNSGIVIKSKRPLARETAAVFARKADSLSDERLNEIKKLIEKGSDK